MPRHPRWAALAGLLSALFAESAAADVALSGSFAATQSCPALQSIRRGTNPGSVRLQPGRAYPLLAKNRDDATHYRLRIDGAEPAERWVEVGCGSVAGADVADKGGQPAQKTGADRLVLAISWQPAFCEGHSGVTECRTQTSARPDASQFSLHGLWPQPRARAYCGVAPAIVATDKAHRWDDLPEPQVGADTRTRLEAVMPGTASQLDRHEWIVHGTCYGASADTYFADSVRLIDAINRSDVKTLFAGRIGRKVTSAEVRAAFDSSFGAGAGERVRLACVDDGRRRLVVEITVGLVGSPSAGTPIGDLIAASAPTDAGCNEGVVDAVGLQ